MLETIITELLPAALSVVAVVVSMVKGKNKKTKTVREIEEQEEARKQKRVAKQLKKNGIKPIDFYEPVFTHLDEVDTESSKNKEQNEKKLVSYEDYLKEKIGE